MRACAVQFKARSTVSSGLGWLQRALGPVDADLIVLPEMALVGYGFTTRDQIAVVAELPSGPMVRGFSALARASSAWLVAGFPERHFDKFFNSAVIINPVGERVAVYRKRLLFEADEGWASPGDSGYQAVMTDFGKLGVGICMDLNDDRLLQWCADDEVEVLAFPTNWVKEDSNPLDYWMWRLSTGWPPELGIPETIVDRAQVEAVLVAANSYGVEGAYSISGNSSILRRNQVYALAPPTGDGVLVKEVQSNRLSGVLV